MNRRCPQCNKTNSSCTIYHAAETRVKIEILHGVRFSGARSKEAKAFPGRLQLQSYLFGVHP